MMRIKSSFPPLNYKLENFIRNTENNTLSNQKTKEKQSNFN